MYEPTINLVDDDAEVLNSLKWMIESVGHKVTCHETAEHFLKSDEYNNPGCIVLDVRMPGMSGMQMQELLKDRGVNTPIIFITAHADVDMAIRAMKGKAFDFLKKPVNNQVLIETINKALKFDYSNRQKRQKNAEIIERAEKLTPREREVMYLIVAGNVSKVIAEKLGISPHTVDIHRARVMKKMQAKSLADLVSMSVISGLTTYNPQDSS